MPIQAVTFKRHRFPRDVIRHAIWLPFRFTLSLRNAEEMLTECGIETNYETIPCRAVQFGRHFLQNHRRVRRQPPGGWRLDKLAVKTWHKRMWLWRAAARHLEIRRRYGTRRVNASNQA